MSEKKKLSRKQLKRKRRRIIIAVEVVALLFLLAGVFLVSKYNKLGTVEYKKEEVKKNEDLTDESSKDYTTIALYGLDSRSAGDLGEGNRSDCIMIASINNKTKAVRVASVFRDTYLYTATTDDDELEYAKASWAYSYGGPTEANSMLNINLDLDVDDFVAVDFSAVANTIDLLGGIDVEITESERNYINGYAVETSQITGLDTPAIMETGLVHLDGLHAVSYARIRYDTNDKYSTDYKRTERQRIVLEKMVEAAKSANLGTLNSIVDTVLPQVATSLSATEILGLATNLTNFKVEATTGFPFEKKTKKVSGPGDCVIPLGLVENVEELHAFLYPDSQYSVSETVRKIDGEIVTATGYSREDANVTEGVGASEESNTASANSATERETPANTTSTEDTTSEGSTEGTN
ncbi:cell envelope-related function transcriptional attenuator common domain-containing protein [Acetitomaculum ruminis DSM 5522]|uniref:Cell envelope-related function transcriptional attenuator common domain-containing protein n=1 Tax=Acetitomaculum ruminis DSM 5522 TaxID=1120918 RepID=A0A1I0YJ97_9FIRM|nr:LCP family protein [Acetitomaculum ruminis]SFB13252.1 cell envelope-related function transcriptional attenuator common domain-containing protein [Acetitomaculum ruminis DSM 5522]